MIYVLNLTIHSSPPNQRPLQLLDVACQQPVVQFHRELRNNHQMPLNIPELSRWIYLYNQSLTFRHANSSIYLDIQKNKRKLCIQRSKLFQQVFHAFYMKHCYQERLIIQCQTCRHPTQCRTSSSSKSSLYFSTSTSEDASTRSACDVQIPWTYAPSMLERSQHAGKVFIDMFFQCPNLLWHETSWIKL